jgi:hypothetical protein
MGRFLAGIVAIHRVSALAFRKPRLAVFAGSGSVRFFPVAAHPAAPNSRFISSRETFRAENLTTPVTAFSCVHSEFFEQ